MSIRSLFSLAAMVLFLGGPALAQSTDAATDGLRMASFRAGWQETDGSYITALDLQLQPGWKTYWRAPGDAGIPPVFDWTGSQNLKSITLHWPSPQVFDLNGLRSIGYHDSLILPIQVVALDPAQPVDLRMKVDLGICKDICLPASVTLQGQIWGSGAPDALIQTALAARPMTAAEAGVTTVACGVSPIADGLRLDAKLALPGFGRQPEVVVFETNDPGIWVSEATAKRDGGSVLAVADLVGPGGAPFVLERQGITVTVISGDRSVEIKGCPAR